MKKMKAQAQEIAHQVGSPVLAPRNPEPPRTVTQAAEEFLAFKAEADRVAVKMAELHEFLSQELKKLPDQQVAVNSTVVYLCNTESESLDWQAAKECLSKKSKLMKKFEPFVKHTETFALKAAKEVMDVSPLSPFITIKKGTQLRTKAIKS